MELVVRDYSDDEWNHLAACGEVAESGPSNAFVFVEGPMAWALLTDPRYPDVDYSAVIDHLWVDKKSKTLHLWLPWARRYRPHDYSRVTITSRLVAAERDDGVFLFMPTEEVAS